MKPSYLLAPTVLVAGIAAVAADGAGDARLQPIEAWFNQLSASRAAAAPAPAAAPASPEARLRPLENWFASLGKAPGNAAPAQLASAEAPGRSASGPLSLQLDSTFESIKYMIFFTPGSARLGPNGQRTVRLLAPKAKVADKVVVWSHSDKTGDPQLNEVLKRKRAETIVSELRKRGVGKAQYAIEIEPAEKVLATPADAKAVWMPKDPEGLQRRVLVDVQTAAKSMAP